MERIVITIHPSPNDKEKLDVADAMQQVIDAIKLLVEAGEAINAEASFKWKLESASTNSPFTVVAVAEPVRPDIDVEAEAQQAKAAFSSGMRGLISNRAPAWWMSAQSIGIANSVFRRNTNGIARTEIELSPTDKLIVDRHEAAAGREAIDAIKAISVEGDILARRAYGEVQGVMVAAGAYFSKPAIQIRTEQYPGVIWCILPGRLVEEFGDTHTMREIWEGKMIGVEGVLVYATGGKLSRIDVQSIRELKSAPPISLEEIRDEQFTAGLDPVEYLRQLHEGELA